VRKLLGIERFERRPPVTYAFFDVPKDSRSGSQVELALTEGFSDARIPLHGGMMRYAFQLERTFARAPGVQLLRELVAARMPWHRSELQGVEWSAVGTFEHASAERYGSNRIWLAGDAAHLTSPLGVQSLNVGIWEARELARTIAACVRGAPADVLRSRYEAGRLAEWRRLLAREPGTPFGEKAPAWVRRHLPQLVSSLPASGDDLDDLLDQLGVSLL
jgi:2-polyprenyl-6-methoxyphenol hydroxylase-like FAD-dependent oxidoreductase